MTNGSQRRVYTWATQYLPLDWCLAQSLSSSWKSPVAHKDSVTQTEDLHYYDRNMRVTSQNTLLDNQGPLRPGWHSPLDIVNYIPLLYVILG